MGYTEILLNVRAAILFKDGTWEERTYPNISITYNPLDEDPTDSDLVDAINAELGRTPDDAILGVYIIESWPADGQEHEKTVMCNVLIAVCLPGGSWNPSTFENFPIRTTQPEGELPTNQEVLDAIALNIYAKVSPQPVALGLIAFTRASMGAGASFAAAAAMVLDKNSELYRRLTSA